MHHHYEFWWKFFPKKELTQIYTCLTIRSFALSLLGIFLPLYLFEELGYSLFQTLSLWIFFAIFIGVTSPAAAKFCSRYGVKHSVLFSIPLYILFLFLLYLLPVFKTPLYVLGSLCGISVAFFWIGMHQIFYDASDQKHRGEEFGKRRALMILGSLFGPLVGGLLIRVIGFKPVFAIASLLLIASGIILFLSKENHTRYHFSFRSLVDKDQWKNSLFFVTLGTRNFADGVIWPLFVFVILGDYFSLGLVGSILAGVSALLVWITGKYSDKIGKRKIIRWAIGFDSLAWILRGLVSTVTQVFSVTIFAAITRGVIAAPLGALNYDKAKGNTAAYFVNREIFIAFGRILLLMIVLATNYLAGGLFFQGFASFAALLF